MSGIKHETIHVHKNFSGPSFYVVFLFIPSIVFVLGIVGFLRLFPSEQPEVVNSTEAEVIAVENEMKTVRLGTVEVFVEIVDDEIGRRNGLSRRDSLGENSGMLFVFEKQNVRPSFWMRNVRFPIDIVWVNDGEIVQIDRNVPTELGEAVDDLKIYLPTEEIDYVLEVNAGYCAQNLIEVGDPVDFAGTF